MQTRDSSWSASEISDEAMRKDGACSHVANPQPPTLFYGVMPDVAVRQAEQWATTQVCEVRTKKGINKRAYRADAPIMSNGVISLPNERIDDWPEFRDASIAWLKNRYGDRLLSVVEHLDEAHPHLHFYCVPRINEDFGAVHEGYAASRKARGGDNKIRTAHQSAMKQWQDDFHSDVGSKFDLLRVGPKRMRLERDEALIERDKKEAAEKLAHAADVKRQAENLAKTVLTEQKKLHAKREEFLAEKSGAATLGGKIGTLLAAYNSTFDSLILRKENAEEENEKLKQEVKQVQASTGKKIADAKNEGMKFGEQQSAVKLADMHHHATKLLTEEQMNTKREADRAASLEAANVAMRRELEKVYGRNYKVPGVDDCRPT